ncbi:MAG: hypothetical protein RL119_81 [Actinomycetota bacterium]
MRNPGAVLGIRQTNRSDGPVKGNAADHQSRRSRIDTQHIVGVDLISPEDGEHYLGLIAKPIRESWPQGTVGQTASQNGGLTGTPFPTEECSRNLSSRVGPFFNVHGQRKKVNPRTSVFGGVGGSQHNAVADAGNDCPLTLRGKFAGLQ